MRLLDDRERRTPNLIDPALRQVVGGMLVQDRDIDLEERAEMQVVSQRRPTEAEWSELLFAWRVCKHVRSNAIVLTRELATVGIGAGQMSRVDSVRLAIEKARSELNGSAMASDAYFPFADGPAARPRRRRHRDHPAGRLGPRPRQSSRPSTPSARRWCSPAAGTSGIEPRRTSRRRPAVTVRGSLRLQPCRCAPGRSCSSAARRPSTRTASCSVAAPYEQTIEILRKVEHELGRVGATLADVVSDPLLRHRHLPRRGGRARPRRGVRRASGR